MTSCESLKRGEFPYLQYNPLICTEKIKVETFFVVVAISLKKTLVNLKKPQTGVEVMSFLYMMTGQNCIQMISCLNDFLRLLPISPFWSVILWLISLLLSCFQRVRLNYEDTISHWKKWHPFLWSMGNSPITYPGNNLDECFKELNTKNWPKFDLKFRWIQSLFSLRLKKPHFRGQL